VIFRNDPVSGRALFVSTNVAQIMGYPPHAFLSNPGFWQEHLHRDDLARIRDAQAQAIAARRERLEYEYRFLHGDGSTHWFFDFRSLRYATDGTLTSDVGYAIDMSERHAAEHAVRASEVHFRTLFEHSPDAITLVDPHDPIVPWRIVDGNPAAWGMHGFDREELIGQTNELLNPGQNDWVENTAFLALIREAGVVQGQVHHRRKDGSVFPVEYSAALVMVDGKELVLGIDRDVTEREKIEQALRESEQRFRQLAEHMREIFWLVDVDQDQVIYVSPAFEQVWGMTREQLYARREIWYENIHPEDRERVEAALARQRAGTYDEEYRIVRPDGMQRWIRDRCFPVRDAQGAVYRLAGITEDITERKQAEELLRHQALYDPLTGLPNRALLHDRLANALARSRRHQDARFALLFLDLDRFKTINDSLGHAAGDTLLIGVARRLETCLRPGDTVARLGGDEFVLLLDEIADARDATAVALRIQQTLAEPLSIEGYTFSTSASIGITLNTPSYERPDEILRDADTAMYRAKAQGRARHALFDPRIHD
jgi:diguanylate cyclase (GGDEF)-like protein/PAS domain S-box-containing protein